MADGTGNGAIQKFRDVLESPLEKLKTWKDTSKKKLVACSPMHFPEELVHAAEMLPAGMNMPAKGYLRAYLQAGFSPADLTADILARIDTGALLVNFSGHGYLEGWTDEQIFDAGDVGALNNGGKYPFMANALSIF